MREYNSHVLLCSTTHERNYRPLCYTYFAGKYIYKTHFRCYILTRQRPGDKSFDVYNDVKGVW